MELLTWNLAGKKAPTGGTKWEEYVKPLVLSEGSDVGCFQEFGKVPDDEELTQVAQWPARSTTLYRWKSYIMGEPYYLLHYRWSPKQSKTDVAILWRSSLTPTDPQGAVEFVDPAHGFPKARGAPGVVTQGGLSVYSVHGLSKSNKRNDVRRLLEGIDGKGRPWIAAGDLNVEPDKLSTWLNEYGDGWTICPPKQATREGMKYDYAVRNAGTRVTGDVLGMSPSDHNPVVFRGL